MKRMSKKEEKRRRNIHTCRIDLLYVHIDIIVFYFRTQRFGRARAQQKNRQVQHPGLLLLAYSSACSMSQLLSIRFAHESILGGNHGNKISGNLRPMNNRKWRRRRGTSAWIEFERETQNRRDHLLTLFMDLECGVRDCRFTGLTERARILTPTGLSTMLYPTLFAPYFAGLRKLAIVAADVTDTRIDTI